MAALLRLVPLPVHKGNRGDLISLERWDPLPFEPKRAFLLKNVPAGEVRGAHAVSSDEFLVLVSGQCRVTVRSKDCQDRYCLDDLGMGMFVPAGIWLKLDQFSKDASVLVLCSAQYANTVYHSEPQI